MKTVTWLCNGEEVGSKYAQSQSLLDKSSATYEHTLSGRDFQGSFTCEVGGNSHMASRTLSLWGEFIITSYSCMIP